MNLLAPGKGIQFDSGYYKIADVAEHPTAPQKYVSVKVGDSKNKFSWKSVPR